jgi:guanylate kinase
MFDARAGESVRFAMTELEERLNGRNGEQAATAILSRLAKLADEIAAHQRSGPSPGDYARAEVIAGAIAAARSVVITISRVG